LFSKRAWIIGAITCLLTGGLSASVRINEIHFHPPAPFGKSQEFLELKNSGPGAVDLSGWRIEGGIEFDFAEGTILRVGELLVLARDPAGLAAGFPAVDIAAIEMFAGAFDNDGDDVRVVDEHGAFVDGVVFDDRFPWPADADGGGESLQRQCLEAPADSASSWQAGVGASPTPLADNENARCPAPVSAPPRVVINEIHFHPFGDQEHLEEFVELFNPGAEDVDLSGWRLVGTGFTFPNDTVIAGESFLVVCRNAEFIRLRFGIQNAIGDFSGKLANAGERLVLVDRDDTPVDSVRYRDQGDWSWTADGAGRSLERIDPFGDSNDPANWSPSLPAASGFERFEAIGSLSSLSRQRVVFSNNGAGEYIIDNVVVEPLDEPGVNLVTNGDFEDGVTGLRLRGLAENSVVEDGVGIDGSAGLRLITTGSCGREGCESCIAADSVYFEFRQGDERDSLADYRLSMSVRYVSGAVRFVGRVLAGVAICVDGFLASPGKVNGARSDAPPPFISDRTRFPVEPTSADRPSISARVRAPSGTPINSVELTYFVESGDAEVLPMLDDGSSRDGEAGDGVYGAVLPEAYEHDTIILYRITATDEDGRSQTLPRTTNLDLDDQGRIPLSDEPVDLYGFYVNDDQPESLLPVYHLRIPDLVDASSPTAINQVLDCDRLTGASFMCGGEVYPEIVIRFRGNTACVLTKRNLKVRFHRGRYFDGLRKMNFQGMWTDKSLVREKLAWDFIRQLGIPYCETEHVRMHVNGLYHGLFLYLEHPDGRFLERNGLDGEDCLYKARQPGNAQGPIGTAQAPSVDGYASLWEQETCEDGGFDGIANFIDSMHADSRVAGGPTALFYSEKTNIDHLIGYQISQVVLNNIDSFAKNHFLYWDVEVDKWSLLTWDMDLTFGKFFDSRIAPVGTINDCMLTSHPFELNPWFTTTVQRNTQRLYMMDFFMNADDGFFQRSYLVRLSSILREKYRNDVYDPILDEELAFLELEEADDFDRWGRSAPRCWADCPLICVDTIDMLSNVQEVKRQLLLHRNFLQDYIRKRHAGIEDHPRMKITEVMFNPTTGNPDEGNPGAETSALEFVELLNTTGREIDIGEWAIDGGITAVFPLGTKVPKDGVVIFAKSKAALLERYPDLEQRAQVFGNYQGSLSNNGETLRLLDSGEFGRSYPATIDYLDYRDGGEWPDVVPGHSIELIIPDDETDNDQPHNWQQSRMALGSPGAVDHTSGVQTFVRGDATADGAVNLSDAVTILNHLFLGDTDLVCRDAADADDDGKLILTDALFVLDFLFRGGRTLPAPFPEPGIDLTEDALDCTGV